jgi:hypothetical protein
MKLRSRATELTATSPATARSCRRSAGRIQGHAGQVHCEKFGAANGAAWAAEGLSYEQGLEKHAEALASQLSMSESGKEGARNEAGRDPARRSRARQLHDDRQARRRRRHAAAHADPVSHLGNLGKFAASIAGKLPK